MTKKESQAVARTGERFRAQAAADIALGFGGAYLAGRYNRNAQIMGYNANAVLGAGAALMFRRAKRMGGKVARQIAAAAVGAGHYGAGKIGETHGEEDGNDGNLISWGKKQGSDKNEFYTD